MFRDIKFIFMGKQKKKNLGNKFCVEVKSSRQVNRTTGEV